MSTVIDSALVDHAAPQATAQALRALSECATGRFYQDYGGGWIFQGKDGARRVKSIGEALHDFGAVSFGRAGKGGAAAVLPYPHQLPYIRWLDRVLADTPLPRVQGLYRLPAVHLDEDGTFHQAHAGAHHEVLWTGEMVDLEGADPACPHLHTWLSGLEWAAPEYLANFLGYVFACFARPTCPSFPFMVVDGITRKVGKTTLINALSYLLTGFVVPPLTFSGGEQEMEKRIAGQCGFPGPNVICIDNVRPTRERAIRSQLLAQAVTSPTVAIRQVYGVRATALDFPLILITMNGAAVEHDLHDRVVRVVLGGQMGRYFRPHPLTYVIENRKALLKEIINVLHGCPFDRSLPVSSRFGEFEWLAQGALSRINLSPNYDPDQLDCADGSVQELRALVDDLMEDAGRHPVSLTTVADRAFFASSTPELEAALRLYPTPTNRSRAQALLRFIKGLEGRRLTHEGKAFKFEVLEEAGKEGMYVRLV